jgi:hypothetical protein
MPVAIRLIRRGHRRSKFLAADHHLAGFDFEDVVKQVELGHESLDFLQDVCGGPPFWEVI